MNKIKYDYEINAYTICLKNISRYFQKRIIVYQSMAHSLCLLNIVVYNDIL